MHEKLRHSLQLVFLHKKEIQDNIKYYNKLKRNANELPQLSTGKIYIKGNM